MQGEAGNFANACMSGSLLGRASGAAACVVKCCVHATGSPVTCDISVHTSLHLLPYLCCVQESAAEIAQRIADSNSRASRSGGNGDGEGDDGNVSDDEDDLKLPPEEDQKSFESVQADLRTMDEIFEILAQVGCELQCGLCKNVCLLAVCMPSFVHGGMCQHPRCHPPGWTQKCWFWTRHARRHALTHAPSMPRCLGWTMALWRSVSCVVWQQQGSWEPWKKLGGSCGHVWSAFGLASVIARPLLQTCLSGNRRPLSAYCSTQTSWNRSLGRHPQRLLTVMKHNKGTLHNAGVWYLDCQLHSSYVTFALAP